jgi:hypothetical protein
VAVQAFGFEQFVEEFESEGVVACGHKGDVAHVAGAVSSFTSTRFASREFVES